MFNRPTAMSDDKLPYAILVQHLAAAPLLTKDPAVWPCCAAAVASACLCRCLEMSLYGDRCCSTILTTALKPHSKLHQCWPAYESRQPLLALPSLAHILFVNLWLCFHRHSGDLPEQGVHGDRVCADACRLGVVVGGESFYSTFVCLTASPPRRC